MPHLYDIGPHKVLSLIFHSQRCHEVGRLRSRLWSLVVKNTDFLVWAWVWILTLFNLICKTVSTVVSTFLHCMAERVEWDTNTWKAFGTMPTGDKCPETMDMMIFKGVCFPDYVLTANTRRWNSLLSNRWFINKEVKESGVRPGCGCNLDHSFAPVALEVHPPHPNVILPWLPRDEKEHTNARAAGKRRLHGTRSLPHSLQGATLLEGTESVPLGRERSSGPAASAFLPEWPLPLLHPAPDPTPS